MSGSLVLMMEVSVRTHHCLGFTFFRDSTLLQFTVDELFHCTASKNTPPCETVALPAIKVFHHWSTWSRWHSCESRLRSSQVPLLTHSMCITHCVTLLLRKSRVSFSSPRAWDQPMRISQTFFGRCVCAKRMCSSFLRLDILNSTLSSWILAGELFPVLIPKSPRLYSRFPSFLSGAENEAWH